MPMAMARHILVKTRDEAEQLKTKLSKGADFALLAKKHSLCPSKKRGGSLGEVRPGQMVKAFDQVVFKKPPNQVHGPVKTPFGYHLIEVLFRD
ncbi:MAG: peptidyl-prolyl cis-trans isomerase C [Motiliproteus sp.]|jgi:peptidyl-prolyl cis-trans isomerase C